MFKDKFESLDFIHSNCFPLMTVREERADDIHMFNTVKESFFI